MTITNMALMVTVLGSVVLAISVTTGALAMWLKGRWR
jgi:hypothetical protein